MRVSRLLVASLLTTAGCYGSALTAFAVKPDLSGQVTIDGVPAPGITVIAVARSATHTQVTGVDGRYAFSRVQFGSVTLTTSGLPPTVLVSYPTQQITLGNGEVEVDFRGYSPRDVTGRVLWRYARDRFQGFPGVSARIDQPPFPVAIAASDAGGTYRLANAPGYGQFDILLDPPVGVTMVSGDRRRYNATQSVGHANDTAWVSYSPNATLIVDVFVDGRSHRDVIVKLSTPLPVSGPPDTYINLPVMPMQVSISGFPSSITFDATVQTVQLVEGSNTVTFRGYSPAGNRPPVASILEPADGATFSVGTPITFRGTASDPEDGLLTGNALDWFTPGRGAYGRGHTITVDTLPIGQHRIVFRAADRLGSAVVSFIDIIVVAATGGRVSGNVTIDNGPGYQVRVDLSTTPVRSALTDLSGSYTFDNVPAGNYTVTVQPVSCVEFPVSSRAVAVTTGGTTTANFTGLPVAGCYDYGYGGGGYGAAARRKPPAPPPRP